MIDQVLIKQQVELFEGILRLLSIFENLILILYYSVFTGFETNNKYEIKNSMGQQIFFAAEGMI